MWLSDRPLSEQFRAGIAEMGRFGWSVASDAMEESLDPHENKLSELIRMYLEIQDMYPDKPNENLVKAFEVLNKDFGLPGRKDVGRAGWFTSPVGPYYTELSINMQYLYEQLSLLSTEPTRHLTIRSCASGPELEMILRNYRLQFHYSLTLSFWAARNTADIAKAVRGMRANDMRILRINNVQDRLGLIRAAFLTAPINEGCRLFVNQQEVAKR